MRLVYFILLLLTPLIASAQFNYSSDGSTVTITGYTGPGGAVVVPDTITNLPVTAIGNFAFNENTGITGVTLPASVTNIGIFAFYECFNLATFNCGSNLFIINNDAFTDCYPLTNFNFGTNLTFIGDSAFYNCYQLGSVSLPNTVTNISGSAFIGCTNLTNVTLSTGLTSIADNAFNGCSALINIVIPPGVTYIGNSTFLNCGNLASSIVFPAGLRDINDNAFYGCGHLAAVTFPNGLTNIGNNAFFSCGRLTTVTIPNTVVTLGAAAFDGCAGLTNAVVGSGVTSLNSNAFYYCLSLTNVSLPAGLTNIGGYAFDTCQNLAAPALPNGLLSIGDDAFNSCYKFTNISIPASVTHIGLYVFEFCNALTAINVDPSNSAYSSTGGVLFNKNQTQLIDYPPGLAGAYTVPNTVTSLNEGSFAETFLLTSVILPDSVVNVGSNAFLQSTVTNVTIGKGLATLNFFAFALCPNLVNFYFAGGPPAIGPGGLPFLNDSGTIFFLPGPAASNWGTSFQGLPAVFWNPQAQTTDASFGIKTNAFGFNITGNSNVVVVVEASTNLSNPNWTPLSTNLLAAGTSYFSDAQWSNYPSRFYRLSTP